MFQAKSRTSKTNKTITPEDRTRTDVSLIQNESYSDKFSRRELINHRGSISIEENVSDVNTPRVYQETWQVKLFSTFGTKDGIKQAQYLVMRPYAIHPGSSAMAVWNSIMAVFIAIIVTFVPWQLAFGYPTTLQGTTAQGFWAVTLPIMDTYFVIDIFVQFRVAYFEDDILMQGTKEMAIHYGKTWFILDFLASFSFMIGIFSSSNGVGILRNLRAMKLARLLKLMRLAKLRKIISEIEESIPEMALVFKLCNICLLLLCSTHLLACGFYAVGDFSAHLLESDNPDDEDSWVVKYWGEVRLLSGSDKFD
jgi:hypothetical protein